MKSSYQHYLEEERPHKAKRIVESRKRKADLQSGLEELRAKKKRVEKTIGDLVKSADEFAQQAEALGRLSLLSRLNATWKAAKEMEHHLEELRKQIDQNELHLKSL